jgi:hypothetical protein
VVNTEHHLAHNGLQFQGRTTARWVGTNPIVIPPGEDRGDQPDGLPRVVRLQHAPDFAFLAADYQDAYRNTNGRRVDWPYADRALREFLFLRPLQVLIILDRMRGSSDSLLPFYGTASWNERTDPLALRVPAAQVVRTFVMHFETSPVLGANSASATVGTQASELRTLLPDTAVYRVVNEDTLGTPAAGQFRLELDSSGSDESYFLHVITGRDAGEAPVASSLTDLGDRWSISLSHPTRGSATVVLLKGMDSLGGSVAFGAQAAQPLNAGVQGITVTADGPVWETVPIDRLFADGFEAGS